MYYLPRLSGAGKRGGKMIKQDKYAILTGMKVVEADSLLELAGRIGDCFDHGANIVTVVIDRGEK